MGKADVVAESMNYMKFIALDEARVQGQKSISWSKPPNGQFKLNTNGSINKDMKKVATSVVLKDSNGKVNFYFAVDIGHCSNVIAELWAIMLGIHIV